jgi:hypothetical protein
MGVDSVEKLLTMEITEEDPLDDPMPDFMVENRGAMLEVDAGVAL